MKRAELEYSYPKELVAQHPLPERDASRMMVLDRSTKTWQHSFVKNLPEFLRKGDLIVFNDTKVIPARLFGKTVEGKKVEILLLEWRGSCRSWGRGFVTWWIPPGNRNHPTPVTRATSGNTIQLRCLIHPARKIEEGTKINFQEEWSGIISSKNGMSAEIEFPAKDFAENLAKFGVPPLPPYIKRKAEDYTPEDRERYQAIFAKHEGSSAAPTASLHFTQELLEAIRRHGVETGWVTLHVSTDTFQPIRSENLLDHKMHGEQFLVPPETRQKIAAAKKGSRRVIAVGTTTVRALESDWDQTATRLFITPGYRFKIVDALLTNFHQPGSTLLSLVGSFADLEWIKQAYQEAMTQKYRLFSFGDAMLIL